MNYQTLLDNTMHWLFSDPMHAVCVVAGIAVLGAINGVRLSLKRCKGPYNGRIL